MAELPLKMNLGVMTDKAYFLNILNQVNVENEEYFNLGSLNMCIASNHRRRSSASVQQINLLEKPGEGITVNGQK